MSAILSADDLNDFISPGVACIKPIETLPQVEENGNAYEVTTEEKLAAQNPTPAHISLTDCLACSGCVTSAEAVLVSLQSHMEVLSTLDKNPSLSPPWLEAAKQNGMHTNGAGIQEEGMIFVASVSPQTRASLAAVYGCSSEEAGNMISSLLSSPQGVASGGAFGSSFLWTFDTNNLRNATLVLAAEEVAATLSKDNEVKKPILTSACPGWICYAEKTHPYILPHLSKLKSPQALAGTLLKSVLANKYNIAPERVWHLAIMPCFDKKLEASRSELTSAAWSDGAAGIRDVDCVITARELISMAAARGIDFGKLSKSPIRRKERVRFPDATLDRFLFPAPKRKEQNQSDRAAGSSGGYLWHVLQRFQAKYPGSRIKVERGRNADVVDYLLIQHNEKTGKDETVFKAARFYGFRNIQNLVRRLKPKGQSKLLMAAAARGGGARKPGGATANGLGGSGVTEYAYVEVMACPGGCTNGGGQVRVGEVEKLRTNDQSAEENVGPGEQKAWLAAVDEAYFSASSSSETSDAEEDLEGDAMNVDEEVGDLVDGVSRRYIHGVMSHWSEITGVGVDALAFTSYREVESDVGKKKVSDIDRVAGLAGTVGGGW